MLSIFTNYFDYWKFITNNYKIVAKKFNHMFLFQYLLNLAIAFLQDDN